MVPTVNLRRVIKHIVNGDLADRLCRLCLLPLGKLYESIAPKEANEGDHRFSVAAVLKNMCNIQVSTDDNFKVCKNCFFTAIAAQKLEHLAKNSTKILDYYITALERSLKPEHVHTDSNQLKIHLEKQEFNNELASMSIGFEKFCKLLTSRIPDEIEEIQRVLSELDIKSELPRELPKEELPELPKESEESSISPELDELSEIDGDNYDDDELLLVVTDSEVPKYLTLRNDMEPETIIPFTPKNDDDDEFHNGRKKRTPMPYNACTECPIKYRFLEKLKKHMLQEHGIQLYICKICKLRSDSEKEFNKHMKGHRNVHRCNICDAIFKKVSSFKVHLDFHARDIQMQTNGKAHVCEHCGLIVLGDAELQRHIEKKHQKQYSCHYCGRLYKCKISIIKHLKKHEDANEGVITEKPSTNTSKSPSTFCEKCGKHFVDERALTWHAMLHNNERPFKCDVCSRGFISANRRNQHALTAHTAPNRKCPLCPALFHLRSIVNTHIKKVHLNLHKRRHRRSKHENVSWPTITVPIPELAVNIQNETIDLKSQLFEFGK